MKSPFLFCFCLALTIFSTSAGYCKDIGHYTPIADYPLSNNANDKIGDHDAMTLTNTPFQDGGIYCNGNYLGTDENPCDAITPAITDFDFSSFAVSATFKIDKAYDLLRPVIVCGDSWRWANIFIDGDNQIGLGLNDSFANAPATQTQCEVDKWHTVILTYDGTSNTAELYYDGDLIDTQTEALSHHNNNKFTITHGGFGRVFKGVIKDLKLYKESNGGGGGGGGCYINTLSK